MFTRRPKPNETEEDLLKFQDDFVASGSKPAATVFRKRKNESKKVTGLNEVSAKTTDSGVCCSTHNEERKRSKFYQEKNLSLDDKNEKDMEEEMNMHDSHITTVLSKIMERDITQTPVKFPTRRSQAFPSVFERSRTGIKGTTATTKKSIFAQQFAMRSLKDFGIPSPSESAKLDSPVIEPCALKPLEPGIPLEKLKDMFPTTNIITGEGLASITTGDSVARNEKLSIHEESLQKLSTMSEEQVLAEKQKLLTELNPKLVAFLQKRQKASVKMKEEEFLDDLVKSVNDTEMNESSDETDIQKVSLMESEEIPNKLEGKWMNMDKVESEKLEWTSTVPEKLQKEINLTHRFDFQGNIITDPSNVPMHLGLHHHGDEPDLPGYTLQELFILSRSNFAQQRIFAVNLLGRIVAKAKHGHYMEVTSEPILDILHESGVSLLFRWSLDEQTDTSIQASVTAMHSLLVRQDLEDLLDVAFLAHRGCEVMSLSPILPDKIKPNETDYEVTLKDVVAGLLKTNIIPRIRYILEVCKPSVITESECIDILIRISRHSLKSAISVFECPRLMEYISRSLLSVTGNKPDCNKSSQSPHPRAVRLLRSLCTAGRHLTSRLLDRFKNLKTLIAMFALQGNDLTMKETTFNVEEEIWRLWIVCSSYGFLCQLFREMYGALVKHIRKFTTVISQVDNMAQIDDSQKTIKWASQRAQFVFLLCSAVTAATDDDKSLPMWPELKQLVPLVISASNLCIKALDVFSNSEIKYEISSVICTGLYFLSTYFEQLRGRADYDVSKLATETSNFAKTTLQSVSKIFLHLGDLGKEDGTFKMLLLAALPEFKPFVSKNSLFGYQALSSLLRCCVAIARLNKESCQYFAAIISAVAAKCSWMNTTYTPNSFFERSRTFCLYWTAQLFTLIVDHCPDAEQHATFCHNVAFKCFSQLQQGEEHIMHCLLSSILFHPKFFSRLPDETNELMQSMSVLRVDKSDTSPDNTNLETNVFSSLLPSLRSTYMMTLYINPKILEESRNRSLKRSAEIASFLLPVSQGPCAPSDWPFLPLLQLYNHCIDGIELPSGSVSCISHCLYYLCLLESHFAECLSSVTPTAKIVRLMCVFIAGNDLFLEESIKKHLIPLFHHYCNVKNQLLLDFSQEIDGISSFCDFYVSLLEQYEGVSYGDHLFSSVILLPLHQFNQGLPDIKKTFWCEHRQVLRILGLPIQKLLLPLSWYLHPVENDVFMIRAYVGALASELCSFPRCPVPYLLAVHHTSQYLFSEESRAPPALKREIYHAITKIRKEQVRFHLLHYVKPDLDPESSLGFIFSEKLSEKRKLAIENILRS